MIERKPAGLLVDLLRTTDVLLCAVRRCPAGINHPSPGNVGWVLREGWWYCPEHYTPEGKPDDARD